jgi:hypothetical protein
MLTKFCLASGRNASKTRRRAVLGGGNINVHPFTKLTMGEIVSEEDENNQDLKTCSRKRTLSNQTKPTTRTTAIKTIHNSNISNNNSNSKQTAKEYI